MQISDNQIPTIKVSNVNTIVMDCIYDQQNDLKKNA